MTPKAGADGGVGPENADTSRNNAIPTENATHNVAAADTSLSPPTAGASSDTSQNNKNALFSAVTNLNTRLRMLHAALPPRTAFLLFSRHIDPRSMSVPAARWGQCQASKNHSQMNGSASSAAGTDASAPLRRNTADERALEEAVVRTRMGLLFIGVKT